MQTPHQQAPTRDLTDAEFEELDELLAATPEPFEPLDAVMLDGYLCGVLVQPVLLETAAWLPHVFDFDGQPLPDDADPVWRERITALIAAPPRGAEPRDGRGRLVRPADPRARRRSTRRAADDAGGQPEPGVAVADALGGRLPARAGVASPTCWSCPTTAVDVALARLYRHLPAETDEEREVVATLDRSTRCRRWTTRSKT